VRNALAVVACAKHCGLSNKQIQSAFDTFKGVKRRMEVRGIAGGVTVVDDFGHHPTAIRETLRALRLRYAHQRIWAVFEPRSNTTRRNIFQKELAESFREADAVLVRKSRGWNCSSRRKDWTRNVDEGPASRREIRRLSAGCRCHCGHLKRRSGGRGRDLRFQQRGVWRHPRKTAGHIGRAQVNFERCSRHLIMPETSAPITVPDTEKSKSRSQRPA
jgi:hypothetical protein